jgi:hypothetical protein
MGRSEALPHGFSCYVKLGARPLSAGVFRLLRRGLSRAVQLLPHFFGGADISEYWQALDVGECSIHESGTVVELGVNYAVYAMTH